MNIVPFLPHRNGKKIPLRPIERKATFMAAVTLRNSTRIAAAADLGVSWQHLQLVLDGERVGSAALLARIAAYIGLPVSVLFPADSKLPKKVANA